MFEIREENKMSKITTKDCIQEIERLYPTIAFPGFSKKNEWKRLSKMGRQGQPIVRVFGCSLDPSVRAIVTETNSNLQVQFESVLPVQPKKPSAFKPSDYVFAVGYDEDSESTFIVLTPRAFWAEHGHVCDRELNIPETMLPLDANGDYAERMEESTYAVLGQEVSDVEEEMRAIGYIDDPEFKAFLFSGGESPSPLV
jgi:hypothetical protein